MSVKQVSTLSLDVVLIESSVLDEVPSFSPKLYHFDLAFQTASNTLARSSLQMSSIIRSIKINGGVK